MLFLCVANSARSQIAEGLARKVLGPDVRVQSAGSKPSTVNPYAIEVMKEIGIDLAGHHSKSIDAIDLSAIDAVITLCDERACLDLASDVTRVHWPIEDPATDLPLPREELLARFRHARDQILERLREVTRTPTAQIDGPE